MNTEQLIQLNTNLIWKIAKEFPWIDKNDLYNAGVVGLLKAYAKYRQNRNTKFSTYAYFYIYGEMFELANNKLIKVNRDTRQLVKLIDKATNLLAQKKGYMPSIEEVAQYLGYPVDVIKEAYQSTSGIVSLDAYETDNLNPYETIAASDTYNIDDHLLLEESMNTLSDLEKKIIKSRYYEDLTQSETAAKLGLNQVKVSRYEKRSLVKMGDYIRR